MTARNKPLAVGAERQAADGAVMADQSRHGHAFSGLRGITYIPNLDDAITPRRGQPVALRGECQSANALGVACERRRRADRQCGLAAEVASAGGQ